MDDLIVHLEVIYPHLVPAYDSGCKTLSARERTLPLGDTGEIISTSQPEPTRPLAREQRVAMVVKSTREPIAVRTADMTSKLDPTAYLTLPQPPSRLTLLFRRSSGSSQGQQHAGGKTRSLAAKFVSLLPTVARLVTNNPTALQVAQVAHDVAEHVEQAESPKRIRRDGQQTAGRESKRMRR